MRRFQDLPIRRKLTFFIMLVSCLAMMLAVVAVISYELFTFRARSLRDLAAEAAMIQVSTASTLEFNDQESAQAVLDVLKTEPEIISACIYQTNGLIFASYTRSRERQIAFPAPRPDGHEFQGRSLIL